MNVFHKHGYIWRNSKEKYLWHNIQLLNSIGKKVKILSWYINIFEIQSEIFQDKGCLTLLMCKLEVLAHALLIYILGVLSLLICRVGIIRLSTPFHIQSDIYFVTYSKKYESILWGLKVSIS
jgi:hypothetical protein